MSHLHEESRPNTPNVNAVASATAAAASSSSSKVDQIAHRFFIKFLLILVSSRSTSIESGPRSLKTDKWFNLETPDTDLHRDHMRAYRALSTLSTLPTLTLHIVLTIPELSTNRALVAVDAVNTRIRIEPTPRAILLESWTISATPPPSSNSSSGSSSLSASESAELSLSAVYKHAISLFRSIYTLAHTLPASKLHSRYKSASQSDHSLAVVLTLPPQTLAFEASPSPSKPAPLPTHKHAFPPLSTPLGSLKVTVQYLARPNFRIDTLESLISSRLFNQDAGVEESGFLGGGFTPTVVAHRARESAAASASSSRGAAGAGEAASGAMAIRPLIPQRHSRTISFPAAGSNIALTSARTGQGYGYGPQQEREREREREYSASATERSNNAPHLVPTSPRYNQYRQDNLAFATPGSLGRTSALRASETGSSSTSPPVVGNLTRLHVAGASAPASPEFAGDGTIRKPPLTTIPAFKSSTFASSTSGLNSPSSSLSRGLAGGGLIPSTPSGLSRPQSSLPHAIPERGTALYAWPSSSTSPPSAGQGVNFPMSSGDPQQQAMPPPPFAASSSVPRGSGLGYGLPRSADSTSSQGHGGTTSATGTPGSGGKSKRYSSSFHRRAPSGGVSASASTDLTDKGVKRMSIGGRHGGSPLAGNVELPIERSRPSSALLDPTGDEEDLSEFIRAIDESRQRTASGLNTSRSSESASSSPAGGVQGQHSRRVSIADRRQSPLIGRLDLAPQAPPSPRSPPARLQELNLYDSDEGPPVASPVAATALTGAGSGAGAGAPTPSAGRGVDLGTKLQNMDATFQKSLAGLKERRRAASRADVPTSLQSTGNNSEEDTRRASGPSFRLRGHPSTATGISGAPAATTIQGSSGHGETELVPTPGESTASDGSGYAGVVGRMDLDSLEVRPLQRREREPAEEDSTSAEQTPGGSSDRERRHRVYEVGDTAAASPSGSGMEGKEKVSRYTSVLRRDGTVRQSDHHQVHKSSASTSSAGGDPASRPRRPAMG